MKLNMEFSETETKQVLTQIAIDVARAGGHMYYVGGFVRDKLLGTISKDIDVEVFGLYPEKLKSILDYYGKVEEVGKSYGVYKIHHLDIDFSIPRREIQGKVVCSNDKSFIVVAAEDDIISLEELKSLYPNHEIRISKDERFSHKDFIVVPSPFITPADASKRRDLTINALMEDGVSNQLLDFWGGEKDTQEGIIRHVNDKTFAQDPLRVFRVCQFAARFEFDIANETVELCSHMDLSSLPKERVFEEAVKALMKAKKPSIFFRTMQRMGILSKVFPEIYEQIGCPQSPTFHPEGDVFEHAMLVVDYAAGIKNESSYPLAFMLAALLHDIGKPKTTEIDANGKITTRGHDEVGEVEARQFLKRITSDISLTSAVCDLVRHHMRIHQLYPNGTNKAFRKLVVDTNVIDILLMTEADCYGKTISGEDFLKEKDWVLGKINSLNITEASIQPLVTGKTLIALGKEPGVEFGLILKKAYDLQLEGLNKDEILAILQV